MEIINRHDAAAAGLRHFFTGRVCKHGHAAPRFVSTGGCTACQKMFSSKNSQAAGLAGLIPAQHVHPDDAATVFNLIDYLNKTRGLPPAVRPGLMPVAPTEWEIYLKKELKTAPSYRPALADMERAAATFGIEVRYATMRPVVDTWSANNLARAAERQGGVGSIENIRAIEAHNAQAAVAAPVFSKIEEAKKKIQEAQAREGYTRDELE